MRLPRTSTQASPLSFLTMAKGECWIAFWVSLSSKRRPIRRLEAKMVAFGFITDWRLALRPTRVWPSSV